MRDPTNLHLHSVILYGCCGASLTMQHALVMRSEIVLAILLQMCGQRLSENQLSERQKHTLVTQDCSLIWEYVPLGNLRTRYYLT